jgi:hypothetical protein
MCYMIMQHVRGLKGGNKKQHNEINIICQRWLEYINWRGEVR